MKLKYSAMLALLMTGLCTLATAAPAVAAEEKPLIANGDFEAIEDGKPAHWALKEGASIAEEEGNHFLRLTVQEPGAMLMVYRAVPIAAEHKAYELTYRVRHADIQVGSKQWFDGRIMMNIKDAEGKTLKPAPPAPNYKGTSKDGWKSESKKFIVPEGGKQLEMMFTLFNAKAGTLEFDDIKLVPTDPAPILEAQAVAAAKKAEDQARRAAKVKPQVPVPSADQLPKELKVVGNKIVDADGKEVWLQGVSLASMEWSAGGERILQSTEVAIDDWKANVLRQPVREHFYFGTGPYQADGGAAYRQLLDDSINLAASKGVYVVIDLHRYRAPGQETIDFWKAVAEKYKNHPAVIFELLNEPHDVSWEVWKNGGPVSDQKKVAEAKKKGEPIAENNEKLIAFQSVGMQKVLDAIRETGARNMVIVGGLDWGYDLSGILKGYGLEDKGGNGIVYSSHVYPWKSDWQGKFLDLVDKYPLFIGELGGELEPMPFLPPDRHEDPHTWAPDMLGLIQKHKLHWTGWCFHPKSSPRLLESWDYTPTSYWGVYVKDALAGKQFEVKKLR